MSSIFVFFVPSGYVVGFSSHLLLLKVLESCCSLGECGDENLLILFTPFQARGLGSRNFARVLRLNVHRLQEQFNRSFSIPETLTGLGVKDPDLDVLVRDALRDPSTGGNPVEMTEANTRALFEQLL